MGVCVFLVVCPFVGLLVCCSVFVLGCSHVSLVCLSARPSVGRSVGLVVRPLVCLLVCIVAFPLGCVIVALPLFRFTVLSISLVCLLVFSLSLGLPTCLFVCQFPSLDSLFPSHSPSLSVCPSVWLLGLLVCPRARIERNSQSPRNNRTFPIATILRSLFATLRCLI